MILTDTQKRFLDYISRHALAEKISWTGWTALAYRYDHRLSTDLDFFSQEFLADFELLPFINDIKKFFGVQHVQKQTIANRNIFLFDEYLDHLKMEVTFFPFEHVWVLDYRNETLKIASVLDIAINKTHALSERQEVKDVFDMYFMLQKETFTLKNLIAWVEEKFGVELNEKDLIAKINYLAQNITAIQPFLVQNVDLDQIKKFFEKMI